MPSRSRASRATWLRKKLSTSGAPAVLALRRARSSNAAAGSPGGNAARSAAACAASSLCAACMPDSVLRTPVEEIEERCESCTAPSGAPTATYSSTARVASSACEGSRRVG
eukprot:154605-Chlamydomonas_euryale.AAC.1